MNKINRNNYEQYFLDYLEGELSPLDKKELMLFLDLNPDLKEELDSFDIVPVIKEDKKYLGKQLLKKDAFLNSISKDNFNELCIAKIEGDLKGKELLEFNNLLKSNVLKEKEYKIYELTRLQPDNKIIYGQKQKLKKGKSRIIRLNNSYTIVSVAASVIFLFALYIFLPKSIDNRNTVEYISRNVIEHSVNEKETLAIENQESNKKIKALEVIKKKNIKPTLIADKSKSIKVKIDDKATQQEEIIEEQSKVEEQIIAFMDPVQIKLPVEKMERHLVFAKSMYVKTGYIESESNQEDFTVKGYLANLINKHIFNKKDKRRLEFFDIAQAGVKGINKVAGTNMTLEREYNEKGEVDKTVFNSRLIAFSAPTKKN